MFINYKKAAILQKQSKAYYHKHLTILSKSLWVL